MSIDWFRHYHGTVTDAKLSLIAKKAGAKRCEITAFWQYLLEYASQHAERGYVGDIDLEVVEHSQDVTHVTLQTLQTLLVEKGLIVDGFLANWDKRQPGSERSAGADRVKRHRENKKKKQDDKEQNKTCNGDVTLQDVTVTNVTPDKIREDKIREEVELGRASSNEDAKSPPNEKSKNTRVSGTRLPSNWELPEAWGNWAEGEGMTFEQVCREGEKFKDFWLAKTGASATKADWEATWRNWIRRCREGYPK